MISFSIEIKAKKSLFFTHNMAGLQIQEQVSTYRLMR